MRQNKTKNKSIGNAGKLESDNSELIADDNAVHNRDSKHGASKKQTGTAEKKISTKRGRTQDIGEKPAVSRKVSENAGSTDKNGKGRDTKDKKSVHTKDSADADTGKHIKGNVSENRKSGKGKAGSDGHDRKAVGGNGKTESSKAGIGTGTGGGKRKKQPKEEQEQIEEKTEDFSIYPAGDFEKTDRTMYPVQCRPTNRSFTDRTVMEILLNGKRYTVSKWSVRNGIYTQGLDSRFLLTKLFYKIKNK